VPEDFRQSKVSDDGHVQEPVVGCRVGSDAHPSSMIAAVGDGDVPDGALRLGTVVEAETDPLGAVKKKRQKRPPHEGNERPEGLAGSIDARDDFPADSETGDVVKIADGGLSEGIAIGQPPEIETARMPLLDQRKAGFKLPRNGIGAHEVAPRPVRDETDDDAGGDGAVLTDQTVDNLIERPVSPDADDPFETPAELFSRRARGVARPRCQMHLKGPEAVPGEGLNARPLHAGCTVSRMGIDDEGGFPGQDHPPMFPPVLRREAAS